MTRPRLNIYIDDEIERALHQFVTQRGLTKSHVVEQALRDYFSPDNLDRREAAITKRLDRLARGAEKMDHDLNVLTETVALYIRLFLSVTPPVAEAHQDAVRAQGKLRFAQFIAQLGRHLQRGNSLTRDLLDELYPEQVQPTERDASVAHGGAPS